MSLINDALKHAQQTQEQKPTPTPPLQFHPVEPVPPNPARAPLLFVGVALALMLVLPLGGVLVWLVSQKVGEDLPVAARTANEPATTVTAASTPAFPPATVPAEPGTNALPATATVAPPPLPAPKLQGISYHPVRPLAVVNGRTVVMGDRVGGFVVLAITRTSVTLGSATTTNVLSLSE